MRGAANADLAAFDEVDASGAGFNAHVTAAAQDGLRLAVDNFEAHRSGDGNGFAVDDADGIGRWFIGAGSGRGDEYGEEHGHADRVERGAARACVGIGIGRHSVNLPGHGDRKSRLYYTSGDLQPPRRDDDHARRSR
jgi:hypothetical protein